MYSCENKGINKSQDVFKAEVLGKGADCNVCLLKFSEEVTLLRKLYGSSINNTYFALNYQGPIKKGVKVEVKIREVKPKEIPSCLAYGPAYSCVMILNVNQ